MGAVKKRKNNLRKKSWCLGGGSRSLCELRKIAGGKRKEEWFKGEKLARKQYK